MFSIIIIHGLGIISFINKRLQHHINIITNVSLPVSLSLSGL